MNKYEQLIEHIINDETDKARELFHTIVVEKSRDIYESLIDEQDLAEVGGNEVEDLVDEITIDEEGISEEDEEAAEEPALDAEEELGGEEESSEEELEDRVVDLEDALDELKAEFDALMAGEEHEEEAMPGIHGDEGAEEMPEQMYEAEEDEEELDEAKHDEEESEEVDETIVREYVEKVADHGQKSESGKEAGAHGSANVNKSSTVAGKNDMGGSSANIAKGGAEANPDGTSPKAAVKAKGNLPHAGSYENVPGAKAGNAFAKKESAVKKEEAGVNKTTPVAK
jgi:hypothetical protein